ncbi:MAG: SCO family protein, partial [Rugosibacter sp.]|nr:SCO family protein [Rugosibacter sp.]
MTRVILFLAMLLTASCDVAPHCSSTDISGGALGVDFALQDQQGKQRRLSAFKGNVAIVFFGYTQCPDVCPTTLTTLKETMLLLGKDTQQVQVILITLDPARDT